MSKMEELISGIKIGEIIRSNKEEERKYNKWVAILAVVGIIVVIAVVAYTVYKVLTPEELDEEFEEDFDDSFLDFYDDEDMEEEPASIRDIKVVKESATGDTESDVDSDEEEDI